VTQDSFRWRHSAVMHLFGVALGKAGRRHARPLFRGHRPSWINLIVRFTRYFSSSVNNFTPC